MSVASGSVGLSRKSSIAQSSLGTQIPATLWTGLAILAFYSLVALGAPWIAPHDPSAYLGKPLEYPSPNHLLGTNDVGQDNLSDLIYGARVSLLVGLLAAILSMGIAALLGTASGYLGGWFDLILMRCVDLMIAIPRLPLMIVLAAYIGASLGTTILVIGLLSWPQPTRIVRAQVLSLRSRDYIRATRLFGARAPYVAFRHLIPALGPILAAGFVAHAGRAVLMEANLAFLGLGDPFNKSWGLTIRYALNVKGFFFSSQWAWSVLPAALNLSILLVGFTMVGMGLERLANPRLRRHR